MITLNKISKKFGKLHAVKEITFSLQPGKSYALIGPNGSGKTTLIKMILGMVIPTSGEIIVGGHSIAKSWQYREKIGYMPQIGRYPDNMMIGQLLDMIKNIRRPANGFDEELIFSFQLDSMLRKKMHTLSGGTRQKVSAALAFMFNPPILILDEPTAGLDPVSVEILKGKIQRDKESGKLMIITSHIMSDLDDISSELVYLYEGKIVYHNPVSKLKEETGHDRLGKAVSKIIKENNFRNKSSLL
ncbi:MAG: ABC transporter ATP-binding protein [Bacteroidales bacterium]